MFLYKGAICSNGNDLPRTRGGVSPSKRIFAVQDESSPHPRGCFLVIVLLLMPGGIFPAPAGVFLLRMSISSYPRNLPRTRGGVSAFFFQSEVQSVSSPHPRGCFLFELLLRLIECIFPAPAGVFPSQRRPRTASSNLPRTRGGVSTKDKGLLEEVRSSPHPRGCFHGRRKS